MHNHKKIFIITGASGSGKTTAAEYMKSRYNINLVRTCTTRKMRSSEEGNEYIFLSKYQFQEKISNNKVLEYVESFGNYYGSLIESIENNYVNVICVDSRGAETIKKQYPDRAIIVLMYIQDIKLLMNRIESRAPTSQEELNLRLQEFNVYHNINYDHKIDASVSMNKIFEQIDSIVQSY